MAKHKATVFILHGIGEKYDEETAKSFIYEMTEALGLDFMNVDFVPLNWAKLLEPKEDIVESWTLRKKWSRLQHFAAHFCCDVLAWCYPRGGEKALRPGHMMYDINQMFRKAWQYHHGKNPENKKYLICHSMGCQIGYALAQKYNIKGIFTMGNPFNWFSIKHPDFGKPNDKLKFWKNYWNKWDPVATIPSENVKYRNYCEDIEVNSWKLWMFPKSAHSIYWKSKLVIEDIAKTLRREIKG